MRIALTHPTCWPEVRRGSERVVHDLGVSLASRGHDVTLLTSHRGTRSITVEDGVTVVRRRRPARPRAARRYEDLIESAPGLAWELQGDRFDVVHAFFPVDGWVASLMRRRRSFAPSCKLHEPRSEADPRKNEQQTQDGVQGHPLAEENHPVEERERRRQIGDKRGAESAVAADHRVEENQRHRGARDT